MTPPNNAYFCYIVPYHCGSLAAFVSLNWRRLFCSALLFARPRTTTLRVWFCGRRRGGGRLLPSRCRRWRCMAWTSYDVLRICIAGWRACGVRYPAALLRAWRLCGGAAIVTICADSCWNATPARTSLLYAVQERHRVCGFVRNGVVACICWAVASTRARLVRAAAALNASRFIPAAAGAYSRRTAPAGALRRLEEDTAACTCRETLLTALPAISRLVPFSFQATPYCSPPFPVPSSFLGLRAVSGGA